MRLCICKTKLKNKCMNRSIRTLQAPALPTSYFFVQTDVMRYETLIHSQFKMARNAIMFKPIRPKTCMPSRGETHGSTERRHPKRVVPGNSLTKIITNWRKRRGLGNSFLQKVVFKKNSQIMGFLMGKAYMQNMPFSAIPTHILPYDQLLKQNET